MTSTAIARGVGSYAQRHGLPWALVTLEVDYFDRADGAVPARLDIPYDGILGFIPGGVPKTWAASKRCPVVQYTGEVIGERCVRITGDDQAIGMMAARHLVNQGFRSFACTGRWSIDVMARRFDAFIAELGRLGHGCALNDQDRHIDNKEDHDPEREMANWLRSLPQPVALFFHQDRAALYATEMCATQGLRVPEQVAILGVDNISDACEASRPPLSSVALPWSHMGELGALHLHRMLDGDPGGQVVRVPPLRVAPRTSTSRPRVSDPLAARCLQFLERHYAKSIHMPELARDLGVDRSTLHRHLVAATGLAPGEHLRRLRCERAQELLATTDLSITAVGERVGYVSRQSFWSMFCKYAGSSPQEFRRRCDNGTL